MVLSSVTAPASLVNNLLSVLSAMFLILESCPDRITPILLLVCFLTSYYRHLFNSAIDIFFHKCYYIEAYFFYIFSFVSSFVVSCWKRWKNYLKRSR